LGVPLQGRLYAIFFVILSGAEGQKRCRFAGGISLGQSLTQEEVFSK